jgi:excinuclease ABC subunit B
MERDYFLGRLADIQYTRNDIDFQRGTFRVRGDVVEVHPSYENFAIRIEFFGDQVEKITYINPISADILAEENQVFIYPSQHYILPGERISPAVENIKAELKERLMQLRQESKLLEAQRLEARTNYDIEMIEEIGYCSGIENYSRHLSGLPAGSRPYTLIDYFPEDFLLFIDESHATIPQIRAMWAGDRHRKEVLVDHGFRLPSALDNRPLSFDEFQQNWSNIIFVSATPSPFELEKCNNEVVEQIIRPTGLIDPEIFIQPASNQVQHKCRYLHSEIDTLERIQILNDLRTGNFDVLVGVNLLREGLDLPEVSAVAILDADKEGFLRSQTSLVQTIGRAARNVNAKVFLYADKVTKSMQNAIDETYRRRKIQLKYNKEHNIIPETIRKEIRKSLTEQIKARKTARQAVQFSDEEFEKVELAAQIEKEMFEAAKNLDFERAAFLRDQLKELKDLPELVITSKAKRKAKRK